MTLGEKAAYIQGLADGVELDETTKEGKLIAALLDLVGDMADAIEQLDEDLDTLNDYVEELDEDLGSVEELLYDDECDCCDCDEEYYDVTCPSCGEDFEVDEDTLLDGGVACPACGEHLEFDFDEEEAEEEE